MEAKTKSVKREASPEIIQKEAIALAESAGWAGLTVRALAQRIGYQPPILYQHFKNKDHLLKTIMDQGFEDLIGTMKSAATSASTPEKALIAAARARFDFAIDNTSLHSLMFASGATGWQQQVTYQGMCQAETLISGLLQKISGRADPCADLVTHFIALIKGYSYFATEMPQGQACRNFFPNQSPGDALSEAMGMFISSVKTHNQ